MKKYTNQDLKIITFVIEDVITQSGDIVDASTLIGKDADMYQIYSDNSKVKSTNVSVFTW